MKCMNCVHQLQILLAIDDSESMRNGGAGRLALGALAALSSALQQLEAGELALVSFGTQVRVLHGFNNGFGTAMSASAAASAAASAKASAASAAAATQHPPPPQPPHQDQEHSLAALSCGAFTDDAAAQAIGSFSFAQPVTRTVELLRSLLPLLERAREGAPSGAPAEGSGAPPQQLVFVVSDGLFEKGSRARLRALHRELCERGALLVLLLLDRPGKDSILQSKQVSFVGGKPTTSNYLDDYPFPFYIILEDIHTLPEVLADALRQWYEVMARNAPA